MGYEDKQQYFITLFSGIFCGTLNGLLIFWLYLLITKPIYIKVIMLFLIGISIYGAIKILRYSFESFKKIENIE